MTETLTVTRLGVRGSLKQTLQSTNPCESMIEIVRRTSRNVKRWQSGDMCLRWTAAGMLEAERQFRKIIGYRDLAKLALAVERDLNRHDRPGGSRHARLRESITGRHRKSTARGTATCWQGRLPGASSEPRFAGTAAGRQRENQPLAWRIAARSLLPPVAPQWQRSGDRTLGAAPPRETVVSYSLEGRRGPPEVEGGPLVIGAVASVVAVAELPERRMGLGVARGGAVADRLALVVHRGGGALVPPSVPRATIPPFSVHENARAGVRVGQNCRSRRPGRRCSRKSPASREDAAGGVPRSTIPPFSVHENACLWPPQDIPQ